MKTTYFLGAGASYNAIPIVGELERAFDQLNSQSKDLLSDFRELGLASQFLNFQAHMQTGARASRMFGTIDTYAKHLWLTNEYDLKALKESLSFFFTVWQEMNKDPFNHARLRKEPFHDIDPRYLGLFANYLEKEDQNIFLNKDIRFINWNYDSQIERALSLFTNINDIEKILSKFNIYPYDKNDSPQVVHLNGIAGLYTNTDGTIKTIFDKVKQNKNIFNVFKESLSIINPLSRTDNKYFTFAWEHNEISLAAIKHAESILKNTNVLVIIGYSFPTFNDNVDKILMKVLKDSDQFKMVYYQDPNASKELLFTRFGISEEKITIVKQTNQFILPLDSHSLNSFEDDGII